MRGRTLPTYAAALVLLVGVAACSEDDDEPEKPAPIGGATESNPSEPTDGGDGQSPAGGTPESPAAAKPTVNLLDWKDTGAPVDDVVTQGAEWTVTQDKAGTAAVLTGPKQVTVPAGTGRQISDVLMDDERAVVFAQDKLEEKPLAITVVSLADGTTQNVTSPTPAANGPVALGDDHLYYATYGEKRAYCLASVDLATMEGSSDYCAEPQHGWSNVAASAAGVSLMTFDNKAVSCRTLLSLADGSEPVPFAGPKACKGWDVAATADGSIWSSLPKEQQVERGDFFASHGDSFFSLGPGTTGTLTPCGDSVYFVRDAQKDVDKARLLRWTPADTLEVVYESPGKGEAFLTQPRCAGDVLTVSALGQGGDEQVYATVP